MPVPPRGFDVLHATADELARFGLPVRPDEGHPAFRIWHAIATAPLATGIDVMSPLDRFRTGHNRLGLTSRAETSRNWAGAVIAAPYRDKPFTTVFGFWAVPDVTRANGAATLDEVCSTWIGLDGHRRRSSSLPQIGIAQSIDRTTGAVEMVAWRQWWCRETPTAPTDYTNFPVATGDLVACSLQVVSGRSVTFNLAIVGRGRVPTVTETLPADAPPLRALDAECILERPMVAGGDQRYPLPRFGDVEFECYAHASGAATLRDFGGAKLLRMVHRLQAPPRIGAMARARYVDPLSGRVRVRYQPDIQP